MDLVFIDVSNVERKVAVRVYRLFTNFGSFNEGKKLAGIFG